MQYQHELDAIMAETQFKFDRAESLKAKDKTENLVQRSKTVRLSLRELVSISEEHGIAGICAIIDHLEHPEDREDYTCPAA